MSTVAPRPAPHSPCINICNLDERGYCRGCYRTIGEISGWSGLGAERQWAVIRACDERRRGGGDVPAHG